ncbi:hypothetical protein PC120_g5913 [Phytophthora cactorum]|nr:hypothetical protein PC120_g5913 [Phytophthora cactorum]
MTIASKNEVACQATATNLEGAVATLPRKRGRPKGSKNKRKQDQTAVDKPTSKRARKPGNGSKPRRSLETAMIGETVQLAPTDSTEFTTVATTHPGTVSNQPAAIECQAPATPMLAHTGVPLQPQLADSSAVAARQIATADVDLGNNSQPITTLPPVHSSRRITSGQSPSITALYVNTLVAFAPAKEGWVTSKKYVGVGNAFIIGKVCRVAKGLYQVRWVDSQFQSNVENLTLSMVQRGNTNYSAPHGHATGPGWGRLCAVDLGERVEIDEPAEELEVCMEPYKPPTELPSTVADVEVIKNFRFDPLAALDEPGDLYHLGDATTTTRLRPEFRHIFEHSASSRFFAYIPVAFWQQVVGEMNMYSRLDGIAIGTPFTLQEIMTFLGILFYMALVKKGEYSNYWGTQVEDPIFGGNSVGLDTMMPLPRFQHLRQAFTFRCVPPNGSNEDQAARLRPLLNLLKTTGPKYVELGRNVALDEASVACRSKYGKPLIVYNPMKPVGKYHFRIYMLCCATSWISLNFRLHGESTIMDRLAGVTTTETAQALSDELSSSSTIWQCVLEVVRPICGTRRIVNSDNYYTPVQLLEALKVKGLYARGTSRKSSAHFPRHVLIEKKECSRGSSRQAVSSAHSIVAASWFDGAIVSVISNADASTLTTVERQVRAQKRTFSAPTCVKQYNTYMQGVDRLDQIRGRFSVADGHSFKNWYMKLGLALVDVARANAFLTGKLAVNLSGARDPHRDFIVELISELFTGKWKEAPSERFMLYSEDSVSEAATAAPPVSA